jgi:Exostosin family
MKIHILTLEQNKEYSVLRNALIKDYSVYGDALIEVANLAEPQKYTLTDNPDEADVIIITHTEVAYNNARKVLNEYLQKCYVIGGSETVFCIPGVNSSASKSFFLHKLRFRGCCYPFERESNNRRNPFLSAENKTHKKKYLFSFVGSPTCLVRKRLLRMPFHRNDTYIYSTNHFDNWDHKRPDRREMQKSYVDIMMQSKFAICPRGTTPGSIRLFEAMELGIAPVIISDKWIPPMGPNWEKFAIFVKESEINNIVEIIDCHASEYEERGRLARIAWEEYFSDSTVFNRSIEAIEDLMKYRIPVLDRFIFHSYPIVLFYESIKNWLRNFGKQLILKAFKTLRLKFPYELRSDV